MITGANHKEFDQPATAMALNITEEAEVIVIRAMLDKVVKFVTTVPWEPSGERLHGLVA